MDKLISFLVENTSKGAIPKEFAIQMAKMVKETDYKESDAVAIIGLAGEMPLAETVDKYWDNIEAGVDCITPFPKSRSEDITKYLRFVDIPEEDIRYTKSGFIENVDEFDYQFFKVSKKEADLMDPAQRMFLEIAWKVIEDAGYGGNKIIGTNTGVYTGFSNNLRDMYLKQIMDVTPDDVPLSLIGNLSAIIPSRISHLLNLKGPAITIDTACSSSLVSIAMACDAIRAGKCDMAIAGGVNLNLMPMNHENIRMGIESSDNRTRAFHEGSDGAAAGEGVAAVMLKPLKKALEDNDNIYAVIKGSAMNQDGNSIGLTAPNPLAQAEVIQKAWEDANVNPRFISYIEAHGTGTKLGDPIEISGINEAFKKYTNQKQFCAVSSVKTNIGHLSEAAGIVSLIKVVMAMRHSKIPPSLYFERPNQAIPFWDSPVYINSKLKDWVKDERARLAGVSSFGISGTNCHVVLEEAPTRIRKEPAKRPYLILSLSASSEKSLQKLIANYKELIGNEDINLGDLCYSAHTGRGHYMYRIAILFENKEDLYSKLDCLTQQPLTSFEEKGIYYGLLKVKNLNNTGNHNRGITEEFKELLNQKGLTLIKEAATSNYSFKNTLKDLCSIYVQGADIDWEKFYQGENFFTVRIPTYQFEKTRCWVNIPEKEVVESNINENYFYNMVWSENTAQNLLRRNKEYHTVLIFKDKNGYAEELSKQLEQKGAKTIFVEYGDSFFHKEDSHYVIRTVEEDYLQLLLDLKDKRISHIIHLNSLDDDKIGCFDDFKLTQYRGVYTLFYLLKSIVTLGLDKDLDLFVISRGIFKVVEEEKSTRPEHAPLIAIGKNITQEHPGILCRGIDIDHNTEMHEVLNELQYDTPIYQVAYRNGKRYTEEFKEILLEEAQDDPIDIKEGGTYLISGGTGGLGLEMAKDISKDRKVNLVLLSRSKLSSPNDWDEILTQGIETQEIKKIKAIKGIEENGSKVIHYAVNISDYEEMKKVIEEVRNTYGRINGIVHAAGIPGDGFLFNKDEGKFNAVLLPKVHGTWILDQLTRIDNPDFFLTYSSGLSILSEPGHGDYTAANAYLDSFTSYRNMQGYKTLSINWTTWKETGMAVEHGFDHDSFFKTIGTDLALKCLKQALNKKIDKVLIGQFNNVPEFLYMLNNDRLPFKFSRKIQTQINAVLEKNDKKKPKKALQSNDKAEEVQLLGKSNGEISDIEKEVAQIYYEVLGYSEINIDESFFDLNGDSLTLNHMYSILEKKYPGAVKLIDLFNYTSIATLSEFISSKIEPHVEKPLKDNSNVNELNDMLDNLVKGNIDIDEALKNFN